MFARSAAPWSTIILTGMISLHSGLLHRKGSNSCTSQLEGTVCKAIPDPQHPAEGQRSIGRVLKKQR